MSEIIYRLVIYIEIIIKTNFDFWLFPPLGPLWTGAVAERTQCAVHWLGGVIPISGSRLSVLVVAELAAFLK